MELMKVIKSQSRQVEGDLIKHLKSANFTFKPALVAA